jgi:hypothetical protein
VVFRVLWNLISAPLLFVIPRELERNHLAAIGFLFPVIGIGLLAWAVITTLRWRRFGPSRFEMSPATRGGQLSGTIHTRFKDVPSLRVTLKLTCLDRITRGSGKNRNTREHILWREEYVVPEGQVGLGGMGASIPVRFAIPADARETTAVGQSDGIVWVLSAKGHVTGRGLQRGLRRRSASRRSHKCGRIYTGEHVRASARTDLADGPDRLRDPHHGRANAR